MRCRRSVSKALMHQHDAAAVPAHASFCQVADPSMEPHHEASSLILPKVFVRRFHTYLREQLTLEAPDGQMWKVSMQADRQKGLRITTGWREVARYLHLESGDLLLFDLVCNGHLRIFIYEGEDMCEKDIYNKRTQCENGDLRENGSATGMKCGKRQKFELGGKSKVYQDCIGETEDVIPTNMTDSKNAGASWSLEDIHIEREHQHMSEVKPATGNGCLSLVPRPASSLYQICKPNPSSNNDFTMKKLHTISPKLHKDTQDAFKVALAYSSKNPFTILVMIHSNVCHGFKLGLPSSFAKQHMSAEPAQVVLIDGENKAWSVTWLGYEKSDNTLSGGWRCFVIDHDLKCGDICILELISTKALPTFKVYIFRVNASDAATIRHEMPSKFTSILARNSGALPK